MLERTTRFFASRWGIILVGAIIGILGPVLQKLGNPPNMGICVACFERDIAGALGLHRANIVQYIRPEIIGFVLGSTVAALIFREFKARSGSAPIVRFVLGAFAMIGALVFLGCPWRAGFRLAGGDVTALTGILGLVIGIWVGVLFLRSGYNLGRSQKTYPAVGWIMPLLMVGLLLLVIFKPVFSEGGPIFFSESGPGSLHAPLLASLGIGLLIGFLAQRTRFCTMGAVRDVILMRDFHLLSGLLAFIGSAFLTNLLLGQFKLGYTPSLSDLGLQGPDFRHPWTVEEEAANIPEQMVRLRRLGFSVTRFPQAAAPAVVITGIDTRSHTVYFNNPWGDCDVPTTLQSISNAVRRWQSVPTHTATIAYL